MVVLPYVYFLSEEVARTFKKRRVSSTIRPLTTLKGLLVYPKDMTDSKEGLYRIECEDYEKVNIGEIK